MALIIVKGLVQIDGIFTELKVMQNQYWWEHLDAFLSPFAVTDKMGHVLYANESFLTLFAQTPKIIRRKEPLSSFLFFQDGKPFDLASGAVNLDRYTEVQLNNGKGDEFTLQYRVVEAQGPFGMENEPVYVFAFHNVSLEITLQKKHMRQLQQNQELITHLEQNVAENNLFLEMGDIDTDRLKPAQILDVIDIAGRRLLGWQSFEFVVCKEDRAKTSNMCNLFSQNRIGSKIRGHLGSLQAAYEANPNLNYWVSDNLGLMAIRTAADETFWILTQMPLNKISQARFFQALGTRIGDAFKKHYLNQSSITDALTGAYNRGYFDREFARLVDVSKKEEEPLTLLIVDADKFKSVNDTYGHPVGDKVLVQISNVLKASSRGSDLVARLGGEEFGIVLYQTNASDSRIVAERIRRRIEESIIDISDAPGLPNIGLATKTIKVTVSIGLAEMGSKYSDPKSMFAAADQALYDAKHSGRNQLKCAA